jgi:hypothetical protein
MSEGDVRALLSDVEIGPECCDLSEVFYRDGVYVQLGYAPDHGHYTVSRNHVCVTTGYRPKAICRKFFSDKSGKPFAVTDGKKQIEPFNPRPAPDESEWLK